MRCEVTLLALPPSREYFFHHTEGATTTPRRGSPQYDAWMAARAQEAARPKNADQPKTDQSKTNQSKTNQSKTDQPK